jgi:hypothetical protein
MVGGDLPAVGPLGACQPEDVAEPVVADVPGFRQPRLDLAPGIEPDEALGGIGDENGLAGIELAEPRIGERRLAADRDDLDNAFGLAFASARSECAKRQRNGLEKVRPHRGEALAAICLYSNCPAPG